MDNQLPESKVADVEEQQPIQEQSAQTKPSSMLPWIGLIGLTAVLVGGLWLAYNYFNNTLDGDDATHTVQPTTTPQTLIIGTDATYPPMESVDELGNMVGYDIDLGNRLAQEMGRTAEFQNINWDDLFVALEDGNVDVIISAVTINDERQLKYDFSDAYINAGQVIITRTDNIDIASTADLEGKKIAVQNDTTNEDEALKYTDAENVLTYDSFETATTALVNGEADAIFSDLTNAKSIIDENDTLKISSPPFTDDYYGVVVQKGNTQLVDDINKGLNTLRQQGYLQFLQQKWLE